MGFTTPRWLGLAILISLSAVASVQAQDPTCARLTAYIEKARQDWEVPGLSLAVVKDGRVVCAQGFGLRELGRPERVDEHTIFAIGSSSKAFTSAAVGMLVDEGKVSWTDRATEHLPNLVFYDPYVTREITVRDLMSHVSGLPRYDALWSTLSYDRDEILRRVRYLEPGWSFRSQYGYQNLMFLAAGQIVPAVTGMSWDDFVTQRIFAPLGMRRSNTSTLSLAGTDNVAQPHERQGGRVQVVPWKNIDNIGPAGSINSSAAEMANWVLLQLGEGEFQGKRLLRRETVREMHTPRAITGFQGDSLNPHKHFSAYGLAWSLEDYRGRKVVQHGGNIDGMTALVGMIPEEGLGFVLLQNLGGSGLRTPLMYRIFDAYLGVPDRDWSADYLVRARAAQARQTARQDSVQSRRVAGTRPSLPFRAYAGTFSNGMYGDLAIAEERGGLVLRMGAGEAFIADLEHYHFDTFTARQRNGRRSMTLTFALNARGEVDVVTVSGLGDYRRVAPSVGGAGARR